MQPRDFSDAGQKSRELTTPPELPNNASFLYYLMGSWLCWNVVCMKQIGFLAPAGLISVQLWLFSNVWKYPYRVVLWMQIKGGKQMWIILRILYGTVALCMKCFRVDCKFGCVVWWHVEVCKSMCVSCDNMERCISLCVVWLHVGVKVCVCNMM